MQFRMRSLKIAPDGRVGEQLREVAARQHDVQDIVAVGWFDQLEAAPDERHLLFRLLDVAGGDAHEALQGSRFDELVCRGRRAESRGVHYCDVTQAKMHPAIPGRFSHSILRASQAA